LQIGLFEIVKKVSRVTYKLKIPRLTQHPIFHISLLEEVTEIVLLAKEVRELLEEKYKVESILNKRKKGQKIEYFMK
jgi:hypothetical protein